MPDPRALLRSRSYVGLLVVAAVLGVPVSAAAYGFLALVDYLQKEIFNHLPHGLGFQTTPVWWPLPVLAVGGIIAAAAIKFLPGDGGPSPAGGFKMHGAPTPAQLPGVILAALATLIFGAVLGPEMPLILLGGGLVLVFLKLARRDVPEQGRRVLASAGSFAAISTLLGSPILGAFLLMEASGLGAMSVVMLTLPLTSVLLATLLLFSDGLAVTPLVIVAVVVAYVISARIEPADDTEATAATDAGIRGDAVTSPAADEAARPVGRHRSPGTGDGDPVQTRSDRTQ